MAKTAKKFGIVNKFCFFAKPNYSTMKRYLLGLIALLFSLPILADPPRDLHQFAIGAENRNKRDAVYSANSSSNKAAHWRTQDNKHYLAYVRKIHTEHYEQNQSYLDAKLSTETTIEDTTGIATITWPDGAMYRGQTYYGEIKGVGTMVYPDKSKYVGSWERDLPNGEGTFINPEGIAFSGTFKNGVPHGKCVMQDLDGRLYSARWVRGKLKEKSIKPLKEKK